jgi:hypothetical protein
MSKNPWFKFYAADWRADPRLRTVSSGARGLWIDMLSLMHEAEPRGTLKVNGRQLSVQQLEMLFGLTPGLTQGLLDELEQAGVFSREEDGTIYSRRMRRDNEKAEIHQKNGKKGGNPRIRNEGVNPGVKAGVNPGVKAGVNPGVKPQKLEARSQNITAAATRARELGEILCEAAGITDGTKTAGLLSLSEPHAWLAQGCDLEMDVLPTLRAIAARGRKFNGWGYCTKAVIEARDRRLAPLPEVARSTRRQGSAAPAPSVLGAILEKLSETEEDVTFE